MRDDGGNLFCSFLEVEYSSWEFVWASSFILLLHAICSPFKTFSNGSETDIAIRVYSMSTRMRQPSASGSTEPELVTELASLSGSGCCLPEVGRFVYDISYDVKLREKSYLKLTFGMSNNNLDFLFTHSA